jgi:hypothetical protein
MKSTPPSLSVIVLSRRQVMSVAEEEEVQVI